MKSLLSIFRPTAHDTSRVASPRPRAHRRIRVPLVVGCALALGLALPGTTAAQEVTNPLRQGFHFSVGAGLASLSATCSGCNVDILGDRISGFSGMLQLGGAINSRLVIAGEFFGWIRNDVPIYRRMAGLNLVFLGYPSEKSGFFIKGGAGVARAIIEDDFVVAQTDTYTATTGIGVDIPTGDFMLTPYVNLVRSFGGATEINRIVSSVAVEPNAVQFGVALTVH